MKRFLTLMFMLLCSIGSTALAQVTYPSPYNLASGSYTFTDWASTNLAGTYPIGMIFHRYAIPDGLLASTESIDYNLGYAQTSGIKVNGKGVDGIEFVNSSATQSVGMAVIALNTTNRSTIKVNFSAQFTAWNGTAPTPPRREWGLRLQYRVGAGSWVDVLDGTGNPVEFLTTGKNPLDPAQAFSNIQLPIAAENQPVVYVRWKFYYLGVGGGSRPQVRLDDISISSIDAVSTPTGMAITSITPSSPSSTSTFNAVVQSVNAFGGAANVGSDTPFTISVFNGTGTLTGTLTGTIPANSNSFVVSGLRYSKIENGIVLKVANTGGTLTDGYSPAFNVLQGATSLTLANLVSKAHVNKPILTFTASATKPDATTDPSYVGNVTISKVSGPGTVSGTLTKLFVNGSTSFNDIQFSQVGTYVINIAGTDLPSINHTIQIYPAVAMTEMLIPRIIKSNVANNRVPTQALVKLDNLMPNTQYRYITGAVTSPTAPNTIGGGNNYHYDAVSGTYLYSFNRTLTSTAIPATNSTFTTGANETSRMVWLNIVPTSNAAFAANASMYWRVILTDQPVIGYRADTLHTVSTTTPVNLGPSSTEATGIFDTQSGLTPKTFVLLYDNEQGTGRPLSSAIVQEDGSGSDTITFSSFYLNIDNKQGGWATIIPNNLSGGVKRMEQRDINGNLIKFWSDADGIWASVNTVNVFGGLNAIDFKTPQIRLLSPTNGQVYCQGKPLPLIWTSRGVEKVNIEYASGYSTGRTYFEINNNYANNPQQFTWIPNDFKDSSTNVSVRVTDIEHITANSEVIPLTVYVPPAVEIHPQSRNTCVGDTLTLFATASGTGIKYQWYKDFKLMPGATKPTLAFNGIQGIESGLYHCMMSGLAPCDAVSSDTAVLYINRPIEILKQPESKVVTKGSTVAFEFSANANFVVNYQWQKNGVDINNDMRISGAQTPTLIIRNVDMSDTSASYTCIAIGPGNCGSVTTQPVSLGVLHVSITASPQDITVCDGANAVFTANAIASPAGVGIAYQWYKNGIALNNAGSVSGANTSALTIANAGNADTASYTVEVKATGNIVGSAMAVSAAAHLKVNPNLAITVEPDTLKTECFGGTFSATAAATGTNVRYQWYSNGSAIANANTAQLTQTANDRAGNTNTYYCIISSDCGIDTTRNVKFIGLPADSLITDLSATSQVDFSKDITFTVNAIGSNLKYQWYKDGVAIANANQSSFTLTNARRRDQGSKYKVVVTSDCGTMTSTETVVTVIGPASVEDNEFAWMLNSRPNPSNGNMTVQFILPQASKASIIIRDAIGREVASFDAGMMDAGTHEHTFTLENLSSGLYYYTLQTAMHTITKSMSIVR